MIEVSLPGRDTIQIQHLICDVNGTIALDGHLLEGVKEKFEEISRKVQIHLVTANTNNSQSEIDEVLHLKAVLLTPGNEVKQKADLLHALGEIHTAAIGQGANDHLMLKKSALGICILSQEGAATKTLLASDLVMPDILSALDLFAHPNRIMATLRQ